MTPKNVTHDIYLGALASVTKNPFTLVDKTQALYWEEKGALVVDAAGKICEVGSAANIRKRYPDSPIHDYSECLFLPGFVDTHLHMPQLDMIGSYGETLLTWLQKYTFPQELKFSDPDLCQSTSQRLWDALISHGVTTATCFAAVFEQSADALFQAAANSGVRAIIGKVSMDQQAPVGLTQRVEDDAHSTGQLIEKWHGFEDRLFYALTPRFIPSCTPELFASLASIKDKYPDLYVQSHVGETRGEVSWIKELYPKSENYFSLYHDYGMTGKKTIYAHGIYLTPEEKSLLARTQSSIAHCPSSNLFLGSGFCSVRELMASGISVGLGSDVGGGTSLSMWKTMEDAYKVSAWLQQPLHPVELLYLATVSGAEALGLGDSIGKLEAGYFGDWQILDLRKHSLLKHRLGNGISNWPEHMLATIMLGSEENMRIGTFVNGKQVGW